jgi:hypothetical protein
MLEGTVWATNKDEFPVISRMSVCELIPSHESFFSEE